MIIPLELKHFKTSKVKPLEELIEEKVKTLEELAEIRKARKGEVMVFASGCFDLLHADHVEYLAWARTLGDYLVVAINDDYSIKQLKGDKRPINPLGDRIKLLVANQYVGYVISFSELDTLDIIETLQPDIFARGKDYALEEEPKNGRKAINPNERRAVESYGGEIYFLDKPPNHSTTRLIELIKNES